MFKRMSSKSSATVNMTPNLSSLFSVSQILVCAREQGHTSDQGIHAFSDQGTHALSDQGIHALLPFLPPLLLHTTHWNQEG